MALPNLNTVQYHPDLTQIPVPSQLAQVAPGAAGTGNGNGSSTNINSYFNSNSHQITNRVGVSAGAMLTGGGIRGASTANNIGG